MSDNKNNNTLIIILCIVFWPLGIALLILKLISDKSLADKVLPTKNNNGQPTLFKPQNPPQRKTEICTGCGAPNLVTPGTPTICEYCGKKLI